MCNLRAKKHMTLQEKKAMMHSIVEQWQDSGLSQAAFAKTNNISVSTLSYRVKKFRQNQNQDFIQLNGFSTNVISIRYPNGVEVSLPGQTPVGYLKSLINY
jgi:hypothetical protein